MRTDSLVDRLSQELRPVRPRSINREALLLLVLGAIELAVFAGMGFMRPDMPMAMETPSFWWKLASTGLIAILGAGIALISADPVRSPRRGLQWILACLAVIFATGWLIDASGDGVAELVRRLHWTQGLRCVWKMVALSIPPALALGELIRRVAPYNWSGTALAAGASSAGWDAFVFVFSCPVDGPFYIAVWYIHRMLDRHRTGDGRFAAAVATVTPAASSRPNALLYRRVSGIFASLPGVRSSS